MKNEVIRTGFDENNREFEIRLVNGKEYKVFTDVLKRLKEKQEAEFKIKWFNLDGLWEEIGDYFGEEKANKIDEKIKADNRFKKSEDRDYLAIYSSEDEENIFADYPEIKNCKYSMQFRDFKEMFNQEYNMDREDVKIGGLTIDANDIQEMIIDTIVNDEDIQKNIYNSGDFWNEIVSVANDITGTYISAEIAGILIELKQSDYNKGIDWNIIKWEIPENE